VMRSTYRSRRVLGKGRFQRTIEYQNV